MPGSVPVQRHVRTGRNTDAVEGDPAAGPGGLGPEIVRPNLFVHRVSLVYVLPVAGPTRVTTHDASGRPVRILVDACEDAGRHGTEWDGKDGGGRRLACGVHLARVESAAEVRTAKLVRGSEGSLPQEEAEGRLLKPSP